MHSGGGKRVCDILGLVGRPLPAAAPDLMLRAATPADEPFLRALAMAVKAEDLAPLGLPEPMRTMLLEQQAHARQAGYAAMFPGAETVVVERSGAPVGQMMLAAPGADRLHLVDLALTAGVRGCGVGTAVLTALIDAARAAGVRRLTLSVAVTNPGAARLYARLGFRLVDAEDDTAMHREMRLDLSSASASVRQTGEPAAGQLRDNS